MLRKTLAPALAVALAAPLLAASETHANQAEPEPGLETSKPPGVPSPPPGQPTAPGGGGGASTDADAQKDDALDAEEPGAESGRRSASLGLSPQDTLVSGQTVGEAGKEWGFQFHGFFRAPMRLGFSSLDMPAMGQSKLQVHAPPVVPDGNYTRWTYTNVTPGPWVEMLFQYGNDRVMLTTAIASYNITSGGWRELQAQLGIDRAFLTINSDLLGDLGSLSFNVGVFSNRYGTAGRYDAGAYETYLFGRTRVAGETTTAAFDVGTEGKIIVEHGIGAKMDQQAWTARAVGQPIPYASYEPYPGPAQQGTTLLHHAHIGYDHAGMLTFTAHYLNSWSQDARGGGTMGMLGTKPDASLRVLGADLRLTGGWLGDGYIGYSSAKAQNLTALGDALELLHSQGGWQLAANYFGGDGYGTINTIAFQYTFSLAAFMVRPQAWWGDGADLVLQLFGMYNSISPGDAAAEAFTQQNGTSKMKWGAQVLYTPLPFLSFGGRFDMVQPNLDDATENFQVFSPRLVFRTAFVTHEQIVLQWSHYTYKSGVYDSLPYPYGGLGAPFPAPKPDTDVISLWAQMWW